MLAPTYLDMRDIYSEGQVVRLWHHQLTHLHINVDVSSFVKICETSKCHNFLIFRPIFIKFWLFCLKMFTLSSEIKFNLFRISPLNIIYNHIIPCYSSISSCSHSFSMKLTQKISTTTTNCVCTKCQNVYWNKKSHHRFHLKQISTFTFMSGLTELCVLLFSIITVIE